MQVLFFNTYYLITLETVAYALREEKGTRMYHRAVDRVPRSGPADELYDMFGLNAEKIYAEVKDILSKN